MASALHLILVLCLTSGLWLRTDANCHHPGWTHFHGRWFHFFNNPMTWSEAERHCISHGGHLASFKKPETYNFIRELIFKATGRHTTTWLGATDAANEGDWLWIGGARFVPVRWGPTEPNGGRRENCMDINIRGLNYINDESCDYRLPFVCVRNKEHHH